MAKPLPSVSVWAHAYIDDERDGEDLIDAIPAPQSPTVPPVGVSLSLIARFIVGAFIAVIAVTLPPIFAVPALLFAFWLIARTWRRYCQLK